MKKYVFIVLLALGVVGQTLPNCPAACGCGDKQEQKSKVWAMAKMVTAAGIGGALMRVVDGDASKAALIKWTMGWSLLCGLYTWAKFAASKSQYGNNYPSLLTCMTVALGATVAGNRAPEIVRAAKSLVA